METNYRKLVIGVMGANQCSGDIYQLAQETGRLIAESGAVLLCGGRQGVMEAAAKGASQAGGLTVGILPNGKQQVGAPNAYIQLAIFTGIGAARNNVNVLSSDALIVFPGSWGTLSEIALAAKQHKPVILLGSEVMLAHPFVEHLHTASTPTEAVKLALQLAQRSRTGTK